MKDFQDYVSQLGQLLIEAEKLPLGEWVPAETPPQPADAPVALLLSPHPDDEVITGALPLRLLRQAGFRVVNLALTLGSREDRKEARLNELRGACDYLGFDLSIPGGGGFDGLNRNTRRDHPRRWLAVVDPVARLIDELRPRVIFFPHGTDSHPTHIGAHSLALHALLRLGPKHACWCVETEFWSPLENPNLLAECGERELADLLAALSFHRGEVLRNPYHVRLPAWLIDNVRRGGELLGGPGSTPPRFTYGMVHRVLAWRDARLAPVHLESPWLPDGTDPSEIFPPF